MSDLNGGTVGPHEVNTLDDVAQAAVSHGLTQWQKMVQERDSFRQEADRLRSELTGCKVALEANVSYIAQMESRMAEALMVRDEAVRQAAEVRTVLHNIVTIGQPYLHSQLPVTPAEAEDDRQARVDERDRIAGHPHPL
jgi:hypothetical protein